MSLHVQLSPEAQARLNAQRRTSSISSAIIALLTLVVIGLVLGFLLLPNYVKDIPIIVTYQAAAPDTDEHEVKKVSTNLDRKPSSPSSSMARVIAANTVSSISVPVPDAEVASPSLNFGDGDDFGDGWGDGSGAGGGASFFNQSVKADRIVYVIDYSLSMKGQREKLMRDELAKSISGLSGGVSYQMIFFSGPAWVAGSELPGFHHSKMNATVKGKGGREYEWTGKGLYNWTPKGKRQPVEWLPATSSNTAKSLEIIKDTKLCGGTDWENPLLMAIEMEPPPNLIFFMTDGAVQGRDMMALTRDLGSKATKRGITINTIAMMEPKAEKPMADLARRTGGQFTVIDKNGKATQK